MASLHSVKQEQLRPHQSSYELQPETPAHNAAAFVNDDVLVVDLSSSSSGSEESITSGDFGGEVISSDARSSDRKRLHPFRNEKPNSLGKKPKLEPVEKLGRAIDGFDGFTAVGGSDTPELPLGFLEPFHSTPDGVVDIELPADFLEPLPLERGHAIDTAPIACIPPTISPSTNGVLRTKDRPCRQFWKAGDYEGDRLMQRPLAGGMDHVRVHPKFLHSNATSHKWALGAVAELLDNALDEVVNGATFVNADMIRNPRDGCPMLLIEDDGGGMNPDRMRQCMSLGYSAKSKSANTIGQYGNGFKTSTMRLGADVIVFSRFPARDGCSPTQSIGMLSYSFLRDTGQEDIIVPMVDYEIEPYGLRKTIRSNVDDWNRNMETIKQWSPYFTEADLLNQFKEMKKQGTRIIVYSLWEDDQGQLELDFDADQFDIQIRGANRDERKILMAQRFPNSRHYLTYRHSLRSYVSILYLRLPDGFRIIMRGKEVKHHSLVDDLMFTQELTYKPQGGPEQAQKDTSMMAIVTIGFVKDAKEHIDVQGFNVYHKNRLIKPFWRIWNSPSSQGRGIIGVLEANFVEPAHDKQGFERTTVLARLEARLLQMQKTYWANYCHKVGYISGAVKRGGKFTSKGNSSKDDWALERRVHALPAPRLVASEAEVHNPGVPLTVTRSARSQIQRVPARVYQNDAIPVRMITMENEAVERLHSTGHTPVDDDVSAVTRRSSGPHSSPLTIQEGNGIQQSDLAIKEKSLVDLGRMLTKQVPMPETLESPANQVGTTDRCSHSEHLNGNADILIQEQEEESVPQDGSIKFDTQLSLQAEIEKNRKLEARIVNMEEKVQLLRKNFEKLEKERDILNERLLEDRKQRELEDEELRKKLKEALMRVRELEAENNRLQVA